MSTRVNGRYTPDPDSSTDTQCRFQSIAANKATGDYDYTADWDPDEFHRRKHQPQQVTHRNLAG